jgi:pSer/pThr/pTyr-binding forkhead associated (FHA) protein
VETLKNAADIRAVLTFLSGEHSDETIKLRRDATIIGREKGDIVINDTEVSATHCQIQEINGIYHIFDMNSTNGTFVNNERIVKAKLKDGDVVSIGTTSFKISLQEEKSTRHIPTIFKPSKSDKSKSSSLIETLIESEIRNTQYNSLKLSIKYPNGKSDEIILRQRVIYIGRASSFGNFDQDQEISRKHLLIKLNNSGEIFIEDQGSTNGSYLNGKKIKGMHQVKPADEVKVGDTLIKIEALAS